MQFTRVQFAEINEINEINAISQKKERKRKANSDFDYPAIKKSKSSENDVVDFIYDENMNELLDNMFSALDNNIFNENLFIEENNEIEESLRSVDLWDFFDSELSEKETAQRLAVVAQDHCYDQKTNKRKRRNTSEIEENQTKKTKVAKNDSNKNEMERSVKNKKESKRDANEKKKKEIKKRTTKAHEKDEEKKKQEKAAKKAMARIREAVEREFEEAAKAQKKVEQASARLERMKARQARTEGC